MRFGRKNDSRNRFVDIVLENVAVAAARVVELLPFSGIKVVHKSRCLQNVCENHFFVGFRASEGGIIKTTLNIRENPNLKLCLGNRCTCSSAPMSM